ncbi:hypothetical protein [Acidiphilium multivorum]|uniref:hypothetical protein n=1 Tax=Acidiphilium multivorum TaxID=62140 RepID=UPI001F1DB2E8|nr:hypothetical protein [Acidiphilium multivorum]
MIDLADRPDGIAGIAGGGIEGAIPAADQKIDRPVRRLDIAGGTIGGVVLGIHDCRDRGSDIRQRRLGPCMVRGGCRSEAGRHREGGKNRPRSQKTQKTAFRHHFDSANMVSMVPLLVFGMLGSSWLPA